MTNLITFFAIVKIIFVAKDLIGSFQNSIWKVIGVNSTLIQ